MPNAVGLGMYRRHGEVRRENGAPDHTEAQCRSCRRLRSFDFDCKKQRSKYRSLRQLLQVQVCDSEKAQQGGDDGFGRIFLDEVAGIGDGVKLRPGNHLL